MKPKIQNWKADVQNWTAYIDYNLNKNKELLWEIYIQTEFSIM